MNQEISFDLYMALEANYFCLVFILFMNGKELLPIIKYLVLLQRGSRGSLGPHFKHSFRFVYIELWDATGHPKGLVSVGVGSLSFFLTQITDLNYWPLIRCMKLVLR